MTPSRPRRMPAGILVLLGVLSALLFIAAGMACFVRGIPGYAMATGSGLGLGLLGMTARRTRPSPLWVAVLAGSFIGAVPAVLLVREWSLEPRHFFNQWVPFILSIAAAGGGVAASFPVVREFVDAVLDAPRP
jgi:hypothetical protein